MFSREPKGNFGKERVNDFLGRKELMTSEKCNNNNSKKNNNNNTIYYSYFLVKKVSSVVTEKYCALLVFTHFEFI